jgi:hypothetical protein
MIKKKMYVIFLVGMLLVTYYYMSQANGQMNNELSDNDVVISFNKILNPEMMDKNDDYRTYYLCDDKAFVSYGLPNTGKPCQDDMYCRDNNPVGTSDKLAARLWCICGECGEWIP